MRWPDASPRQTRKNKLHLIVNDDTTLKLEWDAIADGIIDQNLGVGANNQTILTADELSEVCRCARESSQPSLARMSAVRVDAIR